MQSHWNATSRAVSSRTHPGKGGLPKLRGPVRPALRVLKTGLPWSLLGPAAASSEPDAVLLSALGDLLSGTLPDRRGDAGSGGRERLAVLLLALT